MDLRDGQYGWLCRLGLMLPSMNVLTEPEWYRKRPAYPFTPRECFFMAP